MRTETLTTTGGHSIVARVFPAKEETSSKGVCIIATATGVAQNLYEDFATQRVSLCSGVVGV